MEQFLIDAIESICERFGYKVSYDSHHLTVKLGQDKTQECEEVIEYLNELTGGKYQHTTKSTNQLLKALFRKNYTEDDIKKVIRVKCKEWLADEKMRKFLRPSTLFNANKFEVYLEQAALEDGSQQGPKLFDLLKDDWNE